jgi:hypothetical protein
MKQKKDMLIYVLFKSDVTQLLIILHNYVGELVTLKSVFEDISHDNICFQGEKDTLRDLLYSIGFSIIDFFSLLNR